MDAYRPPQPTASQPEHHVLFDEDDPFEDPELAK